MNSAIKLEREKRATAREAAFWDFAKKALTNPAVEIAFGYLLTNMTVDFVHSKFYQGLFNGSGSGSGSAGSDGSGESPAGPSLWDQRYPNIPNPPLLPTSSPVFNGLVLAGVGATPSGETPSINWTPEFVPTPGLPLIPGGTSETTPVFAPTPGLPLIPVTPGVTTSTNPPGGHEVFEI